MRGRKALIGTGLVLVVAAAAAWAAELTIDQIPAKARAALQALAGKNQIIEVESEKEHGIQVYEAAWRENGRKVEAEVTADGDLLEMEVAVEEKDVPEAVRNAAQQALAGAPAIHYEKHTYTVYEVEGKVNGKMKEVKISPAGVVAGQARPEAADDDDDGDDDEDDAK